MTDTRSNEQIIADSVASWGITLPLLAPREAVAALAAAGRLVTPEHDAQVLRDAAAEAVHLPVSTPGQMFVGAWLHEWADDIENGAAS